MQFPQGWSGFTRLSASGAVGTSGVPIIFYGYSVLSGASAVAKPTFFNGTGTTATQFLQADPSNGAASTERTIPLPNGTMFNGGLYVSFDANTTSVGVFYTVAA
jgi:hypothetical protein